MIVAAMSAVIAASPLATPWVGESVLAAVLATLWMGTGLALTRRHRVAGFALFLPGAACAWFLARGVVHSVSPYYGLAPYLAACIGGGVLWMTWGARTLADRRLAGVAVLACVLVAAIPLMNPTLGVQRDVSLEGGRSERAAVAWAGTGASRALYVRTRVAGDLDTLRVSSLDLDGSGPSPVTLHRVTDAQDVDEICDTFVTVARSTIRDEVATGSVPSFMTRLPVRWPDCSKGTVWRVTG